MLVLGDPGLKTIIVGDGVWSIRKRERESMLEVSKVEESGHGDIISEKFRQWRMGS